MIDIQYGITIMGGREVSRPYRVGFSPKASVFYVFVLVPPQYLTTEPFNGFNRV